MSTDYSSIQPQPKIRKGLAVASLILGIISIPTLGLLGVGAITAIVLGAVAISRIKKDPATYGGKGMAIGGIITSAVALLLIIPILGIMASLAVPQILRQLETDRESAAIRTLITIHNSQVMFQATKQKFGTLKELSEAGLIDLNYANGSPVSGYIYTFTIGEATEDKYCVQATRQSGSSASRDFNIDQDGYVRYVESKTPSPLVCGEGTPLSSVGTEPGNN
jgi:type II secretory pathway pseudopilin PulG